MNIRLAATIATAIVIIAGFAMISPLFFHPEAPIIKQKMMLSFSVTEPHNSADWCKNLSLILNNYDLEATVFIAGKIAEENPQTVLTFSNKIDIGSRTYNNVDLSKISDYSLKLQEVLAGKVAVDTVGNLDSKLFQAPYQATDQDIYSLLNRNNITADFSYYNQYNLFYDGQFVKFDSKTYDAQDYEPIFFLSLPTTNQPIILSFDNSCPTSEIDAYLSEMIHGNFDFINASRMTGLPLTIRGN